MSKELIQHAYADLYGHEPMPIISEQFLDDVFKSNDFKRLYDETRLLEKESNEILIEFAKENPNTLKSDKLNNVIEQIKRKKAGQDLSHLNI